MLYDDRQISAGQKFNDYDLIGLPWKLVISSKVLDNGLLEIKHKTSQETLFVPINSFDLLIQTIIS